MPNPLAADRLSAARILPLINSAENEIYGWRFFCTRGLPADYQERAFFDSFYFVCNDGLLRQ